MEPERRKETALPERAQRSWNSNLLKVKTERRMKIRLLKIFAAVAVLLAAVLLPWFVRLVEFISPKGPELEIISRQIANAHTLFNICCALLWLPLLPWMV